MCIRDSNEIGTIQPIKEIGEIAHENGILFHTDAVQAFGQVPIHVDECHIDMLLSLIHIYRNALERYTIELPAGKLDDPDEQGIVCASRELEEETGYRSEKLEWLITLRTTVAFCNEKIEIFVARDLIPVSYTHLWILLLWIRLLLLYPDRR